MSLPYFPMYPTDFEAKTSHLTLEEDGAYNRLLRLCWMSPGCSLPDDDAWIMRRMRVDQATFDRVVRVILGEFFARKAGRMNSPRLTKEHQKSDLAHSKRVSAGFKGGTAKALKTKTAAPSKAKAMPYQPEPEPEPEEREIGKPISRAPVGFADFWNVVPRKEGKDNAQRSYAKALKQASPEDIIDGMRRYAESRAGEDPKYTKHPATWINGGCWKDEIPRKVEHGKPDSKGRARLDAFLAGATIKPGLGSGQDCDPSQPLLAR